MDLNNCATDNNSLLPDTPPPRAPRVPRLPQLRHLHYHQVSALSSQDRIIIIQGP